MTENTTVTAAIADAKDLPSLVNNLPPELATYIQGKSPIYSKTPIGTAAGMVIGLLSAKFGLGWDANTIATVVTIGGIAGTYAARWFIGSPFAKYLP